MTLSQRVELAKDLFGKPESVAVTRVTGTATADSSDGTVTVELPDGTELELPTIGGVREGDEVTIHVQRGDAQVIAANGWGDAVQAAADEAQAVAQATGQHFWDDDDGAHVTEVTKDEWNDSTGSSYHSGHNILINSLGMLLRKAMNYLASWTGSAVAFYDGEGDSESNITAMFGKDGAQIGASGKPRILITSDSLSGVNSDSAEFFDIDYSGAQTLGYSMVTPAMSALFLIAQTTGQPRLEGTLYENVDVSAADDGYVLSTTKYEVVIGFTGFNQIVSIVSTSLCLAEINSDTEVVLHPIVSFNTGTSSLIWSEAVFKTVAGETIRVSITTSYNATSLVDTVSATIAIEPSFQLTSYVHYAWVRPSATFALPVVTTSPAFTFGNRTNGEETGKYSAAIGEGIIADGAHQVIIGKYNSAGVSDGLQFAVGIGSDESNRANAFEVYNDSQHGVFVNVPGRLTSEGDITSYGDAVFDGNAYFGGGLSLFGGTSLEDCFVTDEVTATIGSIAAGGSKWLNVAAAKTGYKPLAVVGYYLNGANLLIPYCARLNGGNAQFALRNSGSSASSATATIVAQVLYIKTTA